MMVISATECLMPPWTALKYHMTTLLDIGFELKY